MYPDEMFRVEDAVLVLARCINNFGGKILSLVPDRLAERVFDSRIVAIDKVSIDKLYSER